jgi:hypothetical protein
VAAPMKIPLITPITIEMTTDTMTITRAAT